MKIDDSDCDAYEGRAIKRLRGAKRRMLAIAQAAVTKERQTHQYKNRTFSLQRGTQATATEDGARIEMDTEYASYVVGKGLSNIQDVAEEAEQIIYRDLTAPADTED